MIRDKIIRNGQWLIIILLAIVSFYFWRNSKVNNDSVISEGQYNKNKTQYVVISKDKSLSELKKTNAELYDSIRKLKDVKQAVQIKYITRYKTDTIRFSDKYVPKDSIYCYTQETDTVNYDLKIKANSVKWFKLNISLRDSLMLVTRAKNGYNETLINHGSNTEITNSTVFIPKQKLYQKVKDRLYFGAGVGVGYGLFNKKPDVFIGLNAGVKF